MKMSVCLRGWPIRKMEDEWNICQNVNGFIGDRRFAVRKNDKVFELRKTT